MCRYQSLTDERVLLATSDCEKDSSPRKIPQIVSDESTAVPFATINSSEMVGKLQWLSSNEHRKIKPTFLFHIFGRLLFTRLRQIDCHFVQKPVEQFIVTPFGSLDHHRFTPQLAPHTSHRRMHSFRNEFSISLDCLPQNGTVLIYNL